MINDKNLDLDESDFVKKIKMIINNHWQLLLKQV
jgi:hypothetical protein